MTKKEKKRRRLAVVVMVVVVVGGWIGCFSFYLTCMVNPHNDTMVEGSFLLHE